MGINLSKLLETVKDRGAWHAAVHGFTKRYGLVTEQKVVPVDGFLLHTQNLSVAETESINI